MSTPKVFISATTGDLRSARKVVEQALLKCQCLPVEQSNFHPDWRTLEDLDRQKIEDCQALIHLVGWRYGAEPDPATLPEGTPRRSYTQLEYHVGHRLQADCGDQRFRVYVFLCPLSYPFDPEPDEEPEEKRALQREHRRSLELGPYRYDTPADAAELEKAVLALREQVFAIQRQQEEVRTEVVKTRRFGAGALAVIFLMLALLGAGVWHIMQGQKPNPERIRAAYREASERKLAEDNAASEKAPTSAERQRLHEAAAAAHTARIARIDYHVADFIRIADDPTTTFVMREMIRILSDPKEKDRVKTALDYADKQKAGVLERIRARNAAIDAAQHEQNRTELQPLLKSADLQATSGQAAKARASYAQLLELESDWPEVLEAFAYFLYDQSTYAESYANLKTALADAQQSEKLAQHLLAQAPDNQAFQHLLAQAPDNQAFQRLLAASREQLGDLAVTQGDLAGALRYFTGSKAIAERLAASDSANAARQRDLSVSLIKLGDLAVAQGDLAGALRSFTESKTILERLAASDPTNAARQRELSVSLNKVGELAVRQGDLAGALRSFTESKTIRERLAASAPSNAAWQRDLSVSLEKLGDLAVAQGDLAGALRSFIESKAIAERLAASAPANAAWQRDLSVSLDRLGDLAVAQGDLAGALRSFTESKTIRERLAASAPSNAAWQRDLSVSLNKLGDRAVAQGDLAGALRMFSESKTILERLAASDLANAAWQRDLSYICWVIASKVFQPQQHWAEALALMEQSLRIDERLAATDPTNVMWQNDVKESRALVAELRAKVGK